MAKAPTDLERAFQSIETALVELAPEPGRRRSRSCWRATDVFMYGTTRATNAILEGRTARTAFLTTEGFPDILLLREGRQARPVPTQLPYPAAVRAAAPDLRDPRADRLRGRRRPAARRGRACSTRSRRLRGARRRGGRRLPALVDRQPAPRAARRRAARRASCPDVPFTLSHELNPIVREYRRASSTAIDASLKPLMQDYLRDAGATTCAQAGLARPPASSPPRSAARGRPSEVDRAADLLDRLRARRWRRSPALTYAGAEHEDSRPT